MWHEVCDLFHSGKDINGEVQVGMYTFFEKVFKKTLLFYLICVLLSIILGIIKLLGVFPYGWLFVIAPFILGLISIIFLSIFIFIKY